jgi:predicted TIM-barrel fold metal-dependent hydrolase
LGIDKMVLGTDYPFESMTMCLDFLENQALTSAEKEHLYAKTAASLGISA